MGLLVEGRWQDRGYDTADSGGRFVRTQSQWRDWATPLREITAELLNSIS